MPNRKTNADDFKPLKYKKVKVVPKADGADHVISTADDYSCFEEPQAADVEIR